jgi:hypothetical protein
MNPVEVIDTIIATIALYLQCKDRRKKKAKKPQD